MKIAIIILVLFFMGYIPLYSVANAQLRQFIGGRFVAFVVLITLAGFTLPNVDTYMVFVVLLFVSTVRSRIDAMCRFILLAAIIPQMLVFVTFGVHFLAIINSADVIGLVAYGLARFYRGREAGTKAGARWTVEDYLVVTIFMIVAVGGTGFVAIDDTIRAWISTALLMVLPYLLYKSNLTRISDYRKFIACFGAASVFLAIFSIYEARAAWSIFDGIIAHLGGGGGMSKNINIRGGMLRASATMGGPLALACFMTVGIFALASSRDFFKNALGYYGCLAVAFLGLLASQSRGSLVATFAAAIVLSLVLRKRGVAAAMAAIALAAWPTLLFVASFSPLVAGFLHVGQAASHAQYYDYRNLLLDRGLQEVARHPITGMRMNDVLAALTDITQGEHIIDLVNVYLVFMLISGIVGFIPFIALTLASGVRATFGSTGINDLSFLRMRGFCLAAFTVVLIQLSFVSFIDRVPSAFMLVLSGIRLMVQERQSMRKSLGVRPAGPSPVPGKDWGRNGSGAPAAVPFNPRPSIVGLSGSPG